jgi:FkbM family methyltransferase
MKFDRPIRRFAQHLHMDAEFRQLGWHPGEFVSAYYYGRLRDHLPWRHTSVLRRFSVRHGISGHPAILHIRLSPGVGDWGVLRGVWVHQDYFHPLIRGCRTILDVGANIGMAAVWFRGLLPEARLACVEPDPRNAPLARINLTENAIDATVLECAVASHSGWLRLGIGPNTGWSALEGAGLHTHKEFVEVEVRRISEILDSLGWPRVDLLKLDIEGLEGEILADGGDWLSRVGLILFELHPNNSAEEIAAVFGRAGWMMERIGYQGDPTYLAKPFEGGETLKAAPRPGERGRRVP